MTWAFRIGVVREVGTKGSRVEPSYRTFRDHIPLTVMCTSASFVISYLSYEEDLTNTIETVHSGNTLRQSKAFVSIITTAVVDDKYYVKCP